MDKMAKRASLEETLEFANKVREAGGGNPLDALCPAVPEDPNQCLIAKNLNFNCEVTPGDRLEWGTNSWLMILTDKDIRDRIAKDLRLGKRNRGDEYAVILPPKIGQVADDFDRAEDVLNALINLIRARGMHSWGFMLEDASDEELQKTLKDLSASDRKLLFDMVPYIEQSKDEAHRIATIVNPDGSIII